MKKTPKKLSLNVETVKALVEDTLAEVRGGARGSDARTCSCQGSCVLTGPVIEPGNLTGRG